MHRKIIPYNAKLIPLAKKLRQSCTTSEKLLWNHLKGNQMNGYDFHRQKVIDNYIVDFFCPDLMLVIEVDGISHENKYDSDIKREKKLKSFGINILRFNDIEIKKDINQVLWVIGQWINERVL